MPKGSNWMLARQAGQGLHQRPFHAAPLFCRAAQRPVGGHVHVQVDETTLAGAARGHVVEASRHR